MILKDFYLDRKARIEAEAGFSGNVPDITLYNDYVFRQPINNTTLLFKYDCVDWDTSSEQTYKADVTFCIAIILPLEGEVAANQNYENAFDIAQSIDKQFFQEILRPQLCLTQTLHLK